MAAQTILNIVYEYMTAVKQTGIAVSQVVLFGSFARGDARPESDIDLVVIAPDFDERDEADVDILWELRAFTDARIEPIPCGEQQWQEDASSPIIEMARREGIVVTLEPAALRVCQGATANKHFR
ncbi:MAG: nucleotidyltransferase domain-containing protein [Anaerolineae bacterium]